MVSLLRQAQIQPSSTLVNQLKRIGELKECLGKYEHEVCGALGLQVHLSSLPDDSGGDPGFWTSRRTKREGLQRLRAVAGSVTLEAWREGAGAEEWSVVVYLPGQWEALSGPTLRLAQWLHEWGGLQPEMELTLQIAVEKFKRSGILSVALREETGGRLCGRCGEEVRNLPEHLKTLHDSPQSQLPVAVHIRVRDGQKSVVVGQGNDSQRHMWTVPEELHRPELKDPRFRPGLAKDIDRAFAMAGKARRFPKFGRFPLPDDITPLPYLAHALRQLTKGDNLHRG